MNFFEIFAECSIALLGFGAVHAVLRGSDGPRGTVRAWVVVAHGASAFILSVLPLLLALSSLAPDILWRISSAIGVVFVTSLLYALVYFDIRLTQLGYPPQAPLNLRLAKISSCIAIVVMLLNVIGWPWKSGSLLHATAVTLTLITALLALLHTFYVPIHLILAGKGDVQADESRSEN